MNRWSIVLVSVLLPALAASPSLAQKQKSQPAIEAEVEAMLPAERVTGFKPDAATDYDLENIIYAAYRAARDSAIGNENYFVHGDVSADDLRLLMIRELVQTGYMGLAIAYDEAEDFSNSRQCAEPGTTELRLHYTDDGIGMSLVAVNETRYAAYDYDPSVAADLQITSATDCVPATDAGASMAR